MATWTVLLSRKQEPYEAAENVKLEAAFTRGDATCPITVKGIPYVVDFKSMCQKLAADETKQRAVQRRPPQAEPVRDSSAGPTVAGGRPGLVRANSRDEATVGTPKAHTTPKRQAPSPSPADQNADVDSPVVRQRTRPKKRAVIDDDDDDDDERHTDGDAATIVRSKKPFNEPLRAVAPSTASTVVVVSESEVKCRCVTFILQHDVLGTPQDEGILLPGDDDDSDKEQEMEARSLHPTAPPIRLLSPSCPEARTHQHSRLSCMPSAQLPRCNTCAGHEHQTRVHARAHAHPCARRARAYRPRTRVRTHAASCGVGRQVLQLLAKCEVLSGEFKAHTLFGSSEPTGAALACGSLNPRP
jgi:hypothetical protein